MVCALLLSLTALAGSAQQTAQKVWHPRTQQLELNDSPSRLFYASLKTNALYMGVGVANMQAEFDWNDPHITIGMAVMFSPYTVARTWRIRIYALQPEFRWYFSGPRNKGHFVGFNAASGYYNISLNHRRYQDDNLFFTIGASYGYKLPLSSHWHLEFEIGIGYLYSAYDVYDNEVDHKYGQLLERNHRLSYFGPTRAAITVGYTLGFGRKEVRR